MMPKGVAPTINGKVARSPAQKALRFELEDLLDEFLLVKLGAILFG